MDLDKKRSSRILGTVYRKSIKKLVHFFVRLKQPYIGMALGATISEPWQNAKGSLLFVLGWKKHFRYFGLNPAEISEEQATIPPILLLHGNYHNQSAWFHFAKNLSEDHQGPLYTVNLPSGRITDKDFDIVRRKIQSITSMYRKHGKDNIKVHIIGHSRGGELAHRMAWKEEEKSIESDIGKIVKLGSAFEKEEVERIENKNPTFHRRVYEIIGRHDVLELKKSSLAQDQNMELDLGHLGLLYSKEVHKKMIEILNFV